MCLHIVVPSLRRAYGGRSASGGGAWARRCPGLRSAEQPRARAGAARRTTKNGDPAGAGWVGLGGALGVAGVRVLRGVGSARGTAKDGRPTFGGRDRRGPG